MHVIVWNRATIILHVKVRSKKYRIAVAVICGDCCNTIVRPTIVLVSWILRSEVGCFEPRNAPSVTWIYILEFLGDAVNVVWDGFPRYSLDLAMASHSVSSAITYNATNI